MTTRTSRTDPKVDELLRTLAPTNGKLIEALRALILEIDPSVREELKWNAPSFRTSDHFATMQLRDPKRLRLVLHTGAKKKGLEIETADPSGLIEWAAKDRGIVSLVDEADLATKHTALVAILKAWVAQLPA